MKSSVNIQFSVSSNKQLYGSNDQLMLFGNLQNIGEKATTRIQMVLLINDIYCGDIFSSETVEIDSQINTSGTIIDTHWNGDEPEGTYTIGTIIWDSVTNEMMHLDVSSFHFIP